MDRLTNRTRNHGIYLTGQNMGATGYVPDDVLKRLAAYEDTGLTPEEITNLHYDHQEFRRYVAENARLRAELDAAVEDLRRNRKYRGRRPPMSELKLLPCPFCGGVGTLWSTDQCQTVYAVCQDCGTRTIDYQWAEQAKAAWNRRAQPENEPIVRCGECIVPIIDCPAGDVVMLKTDFCSYGKRKPERSEG